MTQGHAFDVATVLGIGTPDSSPLPVAEEGEVVLRVAEGLSLIGLRDSAVGRERMWQGDPWYDRYAWAKSFIAPGTYRLRIPVPGSCDKTFAEQVTLLELGEKPAPVVLVTAALLCLQRTGAPNLISNRLTRCGEKVSDGTHAILDWCNGRLGLGVFGDEYRYPDVALSSLQSS